MNSQIQVFWQRLNLDVPGVVLCLRNVSAVRFAVPRPIYCEFAGSRIPCRFGNSNFQRISEIQDQIDL